MTREQEIIEFCLNNDITFQQYLFLYMLSNKEDQLMVNYHNKVGSYEVKKDIIAPLETKGYLIDENTDSSTLYIHNLKVTNKFLIDAKLKQVNLEVANWIKEWLDLFPKGVKTSGYYVKTDLTGCRTKMLRFVKNNPQFNKDVIFEATNAYIKDMEQRNFDRMKLAPYFIEKDGISMLAGYCDQVLNSEESPNTDWVIKI
jgi:hypothetical protein